MPALTFSGVAAAVLFASWALARRAGFTGVTAGLAAGIAACAQAVLVVESLSLAHAIGTGPIAAAQLALAAAIVLSTRFRPRWPRPGRLGARLREIGGSWPAPVRLLAASGALTAALVALVTVAVPPNNHDGLAYHLPRAALYLQQGSLDAFPAADLRLTTFPANAEILALWQMALAGSARWAGAIQLLCAAGCMGAVWALARRLGASVTAAGGAAVTLAALPEIVLQASSAQNDLVQACFISCAFVFAMDAVEGRGTGPAAVWCGLSLGLAVGTKSIALLALPGLALLALACAERAGWPWRRLLGLAAAGAAGVLALGAYVYLQNLRIHGHPSGPVAFRHLSVAEPFALDSRVAWANLVRTAVRLWDPSGAVPPLGAAAEVPVRAFQGIATATLRVLGVPKRLVEHDFMYGGWSDNPAVTVHEDTAAFGPVAGLVAPPLLLLGLFRGDGRRRALAAAVLGYGLLVSVLLRWQWYHSRLLVTAAVLALPALAALLPQRPRARAVVLWAVALLVVPGQLTAALWNERKPLVGGQAIWSRDAVGRLYLHNPTMEAAVRRLDRQPLTGKRLGLVTDVPFVVIQPMFGQELERRVVLLRLDGDPRAAAARQDLDALLVFGENHLYFRTERLGPHAWPWFGTTPVGPLVDALRDPRSGWREAGSESGRYRLFLRDR